MYLHGDKEENREIGKNLGIKGAALENFCHALYEVEFEVDVNEKTGDATILKVNGCQGESERIKYLENGKKIADAVYQTNKAKIKELELKLTRIHSNAVEIVKDINEEM